jgi:hypothetical protein
MFDVLAIVKLEEFKGYQYCVLATPIQDRLR